MFDLMEWNPENKYRIVGQYITDGDAQLLLFDLNEPIVESAESASEEPENIDAEDLPFGTTAYFGTVVFESHHLSGSWEIMRPAKFYKYCADITPEEMSQIHTEADKLLAELRGA